MLPRDANNLQIRELCSLSPEFFAAIMYAETIPVGTCYNGLLIIAMNEDPSIKPLLKIPREESVVSGFTLGYPDEEHFRYPPRRPMQTTWV
jgi:hypothetical protein